MSPPVLAPQEEKWFCGEYFHPNCAYSCADNLYIDTARTENMSFSGYTYIWWIPQSNNIS